MASNKARNGRKPVDNKPATSTRKRKSSVATREKTPQAKAGKKEEKELESDRSKSEPGDDASMESTGLKNDEAGKGGEGSSGDKEERPKTRRQSSRVFKRNNDESDKDHSVSDEKDEKKAVTATKKARNGRESPNATAKSQQQRRRSMTDEDKIQEEKQNEENNIKKEAKNSKVSQDSVGDKDDKIPSKDDFTKPQVFSLSDSERDENTDEGQDETEGEDSAASASQQTNSKQEENVSSSDDECENDSGSKHKTMVKRGQRDMEKTDNEGSPSTDENATSSKRKRGKSTELTKQSGPRKRQSRESTTIHMKVQSTTNHMKVDAMNKEKQAHGKSPSTKTSSKDKSTTTPRRRRNPNYRRSPGGKKAIDLTDDLDFKFSG